MYFLNSYARIQLINKINKDYWCCESFVEDGTQVTIDKIQNNFKSNKIFQKRNLLNVTQMFLTFA
jgi:hypothetical protein